MRKLILYVGNFDKPNYSAAGNRVFGISKMLEELGFRVVLIGKSKDFDEFETKYSDYISFKSFPNYGYFPTRKYVSFVDNTIKKLGEKPTFIIRYGSPSLSFFDYCLCKYCKEAGIKTIVDVVDWLIPSSNNPLFNVAKGVDTYCEKAVFNHQGDAIITISSFLYKYYRKRTKKVIIIPPLSTEYCKNTHVNKDISFVYAGTPFRLGQRIKSIHNVKDRLDLSVEILGSLYAEGYTFKYDIYGITRNDYLTAFPNHTETVDKCPSIIFHGKADMETVRAAINNADYSILLRDVNRTTMAGFPTKIVESISCGTPVITNKTSDITTYIDNGVNGLILDINNKNYLIKQFREILDMSDSEIQEMKQNCYHNNPFKMESYMSDFATFIEQL